MKDLERVLDETEHLIRLSIHGAVRQHASDILGAGEVCYLSTAPDIL